MEGQLIGTVTVKEGKVLKLPEKVSLYPNEEYDVIQTKEGILLKKHVKVKKSVFDVKFDSEKVLNDIAKAFGTTDPLKVVQLLRR